MILDIRTLAVGGSNERRQKLDSKLRMACQYFDSITVVSEGVRKKLGLENKDLEPYFEQANVGISFVPMTDHYDAQPATKTFEYSNSGLYVLGTATTENKKSIDNNGVLIQDTPESFC